MLHVLRKTKTVFFYDSYYGDNTRCLFAVFALVSQTKTVLFLSARPSIEHTRFVYSHKILLSSTMSVFSILYLLVKILVNSLAKHCHRTISGLVESLIVLSHIVGYLFPLRIQNSNGHFVASTFDRSRNYRTAITIINDFPFNPHPSLYSS